LCVGIAKKQLFPVFLVGPDLEAGAHRLDTHTHTQRGGGGGEGRKSHNETRELSRQEGTRAGNKEGRKKGEEGERKGTRGRHTRGRSETLRPWPPGDSHW